MSYCGVDRLCIDLIDAGRAAILPSCARSSLATLGRLPLGLIAASAQTPRPLPAARSPGRPPAKSRCAASSATRNSKRSAPSRTKAAENEAKLKREIDAIGDDRRKLNQPLIDAAARVRDVEDADRRDRRSGSSRSTTASSALRQSLEERRGVIAEVLAALQRIGRQPPPALMVRPRTRCNRCAPP